MGALGRHVPSRVAAMTEPMSPPTRTVWEYATAPLLVHATKQILDNFGADGWEQGLSKPARHG